MAPIHSALPYRFISLLGGAIFFIGISLMIPDGSPYEAIGMACAGGGGGIVLISFLLYHKKHSSLKIHSRARKSHRRERMKFRSEQLPQSEQSLGTSYPLFTIPPELRLPSPKRAPYPKWLTVHRKKNSGKKEVLWYRTKIELQGYPMQFMGQITQLYQKSHPQFVQIFQECIQRERHRSFFRPNPEHRCTVDHPDQEIYVPDQVILEWAAEQYRKSHHISLFVISMDELLARVKQEKANRSRSAPPYFGFLAMDKNGESIPLLFYLTRWRGLECLDMRDYDLHGKYDLYELLPRPLVKKWYYGDRDMGKRPLTKTQPVTDFHLLTQALIDLSSSCNGRFRSLKDGLLLGRFDNVRLPASWTFAEKFPDIEHDPQMVVAPGLSWKQLIERYKRSLLCHIIVPNNSLTREWFIDFEKRTLIDLPPSVKIRREISPEGVHLELKIPFTIPINTFSYEYSRALCQAYIKDEWESIARMNILPRAILRVILDYFL